MQKKVPLYTRMFREASTKGWKSGTVPLSCKVAPMKWSSPLLSSFAEDKNVSSCCIKDEIWFSLCCRVTFFTPKLSGPLLRRASFRSSKEINNCTKSHSQTNTRYDTDNNLRKWINHITYSLGLAIWGSWVEWERWDVNSNAWYGQCNSTHLRFCFKAFLWGMWWFL